MNKKLKVLFAGGGTGGHLYPAIAVIKELKKLHPDVVVRYIGTKDKIEGKVVPEEGIQFSSISVIGLSRKLNTSLIKFPFKLIFSLIKSLAINIGFRPDVAVGSGGYVSGPAIYTAHLTGAKVVLLEQNSVPGITTKILEKFANTIHVTYEESIAKLKNQNKCVVTGNPVRFKKSSMTKEQAKEKLGFAPNTKLVIVLGGSGGADSINEALAKNANKLSVAGISLLWQTGEKKYTNYINCETEAVRVVPFFDDMALAYAAADLIVSRSGATTIAEIMVLGKPSLLIPSPNVTANHQFYNAKALFEENAADYLEDNVLKELLIEKIIELLRNEERLNQLSVNAQKLSKPNAATEIAQSIIDIWKEKNGVNA